MKEKEKEEKDPKAKVEVKKDKKKRKKKEEKVEKVENIERGKGKKAKGKGGKKQKVKVKVLSMSGDTLYRFSRELKPGMNRITWRMNEKGVRFPSRRPVKPDADDPSGRRVLPGTYKLVFNYGDSKDSTMVKVLADPRREYNQSNELAKAQGTG